MTSSDKNVISLPICTIIFFEDKNVYLGVRDMLMLINVTSNNISAISWRSVLLI